MLESRSASGSLVLYKLTKVSCSIIWCASVLVTFAFVEIFIGSFTAFLSGIGAAWLTEAVGSRQHAK